MRIILSRDAQRLWGSPSTSIPRPPPLHPHQPIPQVPRPRPSLSALASRPPRPALGCRPAHFQSRPTPRFRLSHAPPTPGPAGALGLASCSWRTEGAGAVPGVLEKRGTRTSRHKERPQTRVRLRVLTQRPWPAFLRPVRRRHRETPAGQVSRAGAELPGRMCGPRSGGRRAPPVGLRSSEASIFGGCASGSRQVGMKVSWPATPSRVKTGVRTCGNPPSPPLASPPWDWPLHEVCVLPSPPGFGATGLVGVTLFPSPWRAGITLTYPKAARLLDSAFKNPVLTIAAVSECQRPF